MLGIVSAALILRWGDVDAGKRGGVQQISSKSGIGAVDVLWECCGCRARAMTRVTQLHGLYAFL
jgi:hypothetical protein